jgi:hypothetical protein
VLRVTGRPRKRGTTNLGLPQDDAVVVHRQALLACRVVTDLVHRHLYLPLGEDPLVPPIEDRASACIASSLATRLKPRNLPT